MTQQQSAERRDEGTSVVVLLVGVLSIFILLPLVLGSLAYPTVALVVAAVLLTFAAVVRPAGAAAPLRWIPLVYGLLALVAAVVGMFR